MKIIRLILLSLMLIVGFNIKTIAATFTVTKTTDSNDGICNSDCSLREAVGVANLAATNDEINFDPTVFATAQTIVLGGSWIKITNNGGLTINGTGPNLLAISGNNLKTVLVIDIAATAIISGVTIKDGRGDLSGAFAGGISNLGNLTINNSVIRDNFATSSSGGIYNQGRLDIFNSTITNNNGDFNGGGIYNFDEFALLTVTNSTISNNIVRRDGGGIYNNGVATIINSTISFNTASSVDGGNGGGILTTGYVNRNSVLNVINSTISNNVSLAGGGGIMNDGSLVNLVNTTINNNSVTSDLIYYYGGGVVNFTINYVGKVNSKNTIIADNTSANGQAPDFGGVLTSQGYNLIESTNNMAIAGTATGNILGQDPKLAALIDNGGLTKTCALLVGSPAIDSGASDLSATDQRFYTRSSDGDSNGSILPDIGAYELNSTKSIYNVQVSGRIVNINGSRSFPARVSMIDNEGNTYGTSVNPFGYYRFNGVLAGRTYMVKVINKRSSFNPKVLFITGDVNSLNF